MMYRRWRYDAFATHNDVARLTRNDAMLAINHQRSDIIMRSRHHWQSQHHLQKVNIIEKDHICLLDKYGLFLGAAGLQY